MMNDLMLWALFFFHYELQVSEQGSLNKDTMKSCSIERLWKIIFIIARKLIGNLFVLEERNDFVNCPRRLYRLNSVWSAIAKLGAFAKRYTALCVPFMHIVRAPIDTKLSIHLTFFSVNARHIFACHMNIIIQFLISFLFYAEHNICQKKRY